MQREAQRHRRAGVRGDLGAARAVRDEHADGRVRARGAAGRRGDDDRAASTPDVDARPRRCAPSQRRCEPSPSTTLAGCHLCEPRARRSSAEARGRRPFDSRCSSTSAATPRLEAAYREHAARSIEVDGESRVHRTSSIRARAPLRRPARARRDGSPARGLPERRQAHMRQRCHKDVALDGGDQVAERLTVGVAARLSRYLQVLTQAKKMGPLPHLLAGDRRSTRTSTRRRSGATSRRSAGSASAGSATRSTRSSSEIRKILRTQGQHNIALVGAGRLGAAIASSPIFAEHGITIAAVFEQDPARSRDEPRGRLHQVRSTSSTRSSATGASSSASSPSRRTRRRTRPSVLVGAGVKIVFNYSQALIDNAVGRPGPHLKPGRRAPLRPVLPPALPAAGTGELFFFLKKKKKKKKKISTPPLARLPPRRHRVERLHPSARARVEPRGA